MPDANNNPLLIDLTSTYKGDVTDEAAKLAAATAADASATAATAKRVIDSKALAAGLAKTGPALEIEPSGDGVVWFPDASEVGFHVIRPVPLTTVVPPDAPAPTPPTPAN